MTAKVHIDQERVYVPDRAKKKLRVGVFFLIVFSGVGFWVLAQKGVLKAGVEQMTHAQEVYISKTNAETNAKISGR